MASKKKPTSKKKPEPKSIVVTVQDDHLPEIQKVASQLRKRGMHVDAVLEGIGLISGSVLESVPDLRSVPGVAAVEQQTQFQVPPPDAPVK
jgi:hypothetical protein